MLSKNLFRILLLLAIASFFIGNAKAQGDFITVGI